MTRQILALAALAATAACISDPGFRGVSGVRVIDAAEAARCSYVTDIRARPGAYGPFAQQGLEYSRNRVLDLARQSGANAVVFTPVVPGEMVTEITATAYRC
ncbi:MAG: hypothetical protein N2Z62_14140 [Rhodobacteraceae bacterium]|nr:hypothetical protein [Paracoccaceae bacterium]